MSSKRVSKREREDVGVMPDANEREERQRIYLDTGVMLNLCATGCAPRILRALPYRAVILPEVARERFLLWPEVAATTDAPGEDAEDVHPREEVAVTPLMEAGMLTLSPVEVGACAERVVTFAMHLHDRQAKSLAFALTEQAGVVTDDLSTRRVLQVLAPHVILLDTRALLATWQATLKVADHVLAQVKQLIAIRAQFLRE